MAVGKRDIRETMAQREEGLNASGVEMPAPDKNALRIMDYAVRDGISPCVLAGRSANCRGESHGQFAAGIYVAT